MARVAVIGEEAAVAGFALAGALVLPADSPAEVDAAWRALPPDVAVAVLTPKAAQRLGPKIADPRAAVLTVVMPP